MNGYRKIDDSTPNNHARRIQSRSHLLRLFDHYATRLKCCETGNPGPVIAPIAGALADYRAAASTDEWRETVQRDLRVHPLVVLLHEDPYSRHGFCKPRGYPGDAVLLDFIYGGGAAAGFVASASRLGSALYRECFAHTSFVSIRDRRDYLAGRLSALSRAARPSRILSLACGHLREADELTRAARHPERLVAVDQDSASLDLAQADHAELRIEAVQASVLTFLRSGHQLGTFDFIYSAGLYDYLSDAVARRLTSKLANMLAPGGSLLIANMLPDLSSAGYMEAVMDWWLVYRTVDQLKALSVTVPGPHRVIMHEKIFIAYMEIAKGNAQ